MRWMMTWMMAAALLVAVSALPGCETPDDSTGGSGTKSGASENGKHQEGSKEKKAPSTGSGYR